MSGLLAAGIAAALLNTSAIDNIFKTWDTTHTPGCNLAVYDRGALVYERSYGMSDLTRGLPLTPESRFDVASVSKQFTAAAIVLLVQDGRLAFTDTVAKHLPELAAGLGTATIADLLHHTSGLRDYLSIADAANLGEYYTPAQAFALIGRQRGVNFPIGTNYLYSNSGFFLLGEVVHRVSGQTLRQFAANRIFGPLAMTQSSFWDDNREQIANRAQAYKQDGAGFSLHMHNLEMVGDGNLITTVRDLGKWWTNLGRNALGEDPGSFVATMTQRATTSTGRILDYGMGLRVAPYHGLPAIFHGGSFVGYKAGFLRLPSLGGGVILLCNVREAPASELAMQVADVVFKDRWQDTPVTPPAPPALERFAGTYVGGWAKDSPIWTLAVRAGQLEARLSWDERFDLTYESNNTFAIAGPTPLTRLHFRGDQLVIEREGRESDEYVRAQEWRPTSAQLATWAGDYEVPEISRRISLLAHGSGLVLHGLYDADVTLTPTHVGTFIDIGGQAPFTRLDIGKDTLRISSSELRGLILQRARVEQ